MTRFDPYALVVECNLADKQVHLEARFDDAVLCTVDQLGEPLRLVRMRLHDKQIGKFGGRGRGRTDSTLTWPALIRMHWWLSATWQTNRCISKLASTMLSYVLGTLTNSVSPFASSVWGCTTNKLVNSVAAAAAGLKGLTELVKVPTDMTRFDPYALVVECNLADKQVHQTNW
jgi:hypothetical protein